MRRIRWHRAKPDRPLRGSGARGTVMPSGRRRGDHGRGKVRVRGRGGRVGGGLIGLALQRVLPEGGRRVGAGVYGAGLSAFRNGPISAWRGGPLKCAGVCVCSPPRPRSFQPMSGGGVRATQESSRFLLLVSVLWVCGQRVCVVQAKRHIHSPPGTPLSDQRRPEGGPGGG